MSLNCKEIDVVLEELSLPGLFIQNIVQPSYDSIALYLYGRDGAKTLLISLTQGACRLHETFRKIPRNATPLRFMEFMRSRLKGSKIITATQPRNDRIVVLELGKSGAVFSMYIRLWSGAANIIITNESGMVLDSFYRRPSKNEVTGGMFTLPEIPSRLVDKQYEVRMLPGEGSFCRRLDEWYGQHEGIVSREKLLDQARKRYNGQRARLSAAYDRLCDKRESFLHADRWKHQGDLITAHLYEIPAATDSFICVDYETDTQTVIQLDPTKTGVKNAESYYEKYRKAVSGLAELESDIQRTKSELQQLDSQMVALEVERNPLVIQQQMKKQNTPKQLQSRKYPGITFRKDNWLFLVGRSAAENDELLRHHVRGSDMWLHVRDWHGSYVFIKVQNGKSVPLDILLDAGTLAVFYSKARAKASADVYYTPVKYLRRAKNGPKGLVLPTMEKNLAITLDESRLKKLEQCKDD